MYIVAAFCVLVCVVGGDFATDEMSRNARSVSALVGGTKESELRNSLLRPYYRNIRPIRQRSDAIQIRLVPRILRIVQHDPLDDSITIRLRLWISWIDDFMTWNPRFFDDILSMKMPALTLWKPDIDCISAITQKDLFAWTDIYSTLQSNGRVELEILRELKVPCRSKPMVLLSKFRLLARTKVCDFVYGSEAFGANELRLDVPSQPVDLSMYTEDPLWQLLRVSNSSRFASRPNFDNPSSPVFHSRLTYSIELRRDLAIVGLLLTSLVAFFVTNLCFVCVLLSSETGLLFKKAALGIVACGTNVLLQNIAVNEGDLQSASFIAGETRACALVTVVGLLLLCTFCNRRSPSKRSRRHHDSERDSNTVGVGCCGCCHPNDEYDVEEADREMNALLARHAEENGSDTCRKSIDGDSGRPCSFNHEVTNNTSIPIPVWHIQRNLERLLEIGRSADRTLIKISEECHRISQKCDHSSAANISTCKRSVIYVTYGLVTVANVAYFLYHHFSF